MEAEERVIPLLAIIFTGLTAFAAAGAAVAAWVSVHKTHQLAEGRLLRDFFEKYTSEEMSEALRTLRAWKDDCGDSFVDDYRTSLRKGESKAIEVDKARRRVSSHYRMALWLYRSKYVRKKFLIDVCGSDGYSMFFEIVEPLEFGLNPNYNKKDFICLKEICGEPTGEGFPTRIGAPE